MKYTLLGSIFLAALFGGGNPFGGNNRTGSYVITIGGSVTNLLVYGNQSGVAPGEGFRANSVTYKADADNITGGIYNSANGSWLIRGVDDNSITIGDASTTTSITNIGPQYIRNAGSGTPATPGSVSAWMPVNVNGTNFYFPLYK